MSSSIFTFLKDAALSLFCLLAIGLFASSINLKVLENRLDGFEVHTAIRG